MTERNRGKNGEEKEGEIAHRFVVVGFRVVCDRGGSVGVMIEKVEVIRRQVDGCIAGRKRPVRQQTGLSVNRRACPLTGGKTAFLAQPEGCVTGTA